MKSKLEFMLSMAIFGSIGILVRYIPLPSAEIALFRGFIGSVFLALVMVHSGRGLGWKALRNNLAWLVPSSLALAGNWVFLFHAFKNTTISNAVLSYYCAPVFLVILSRAFLRERLSVKKVACVGGAMLGMAGIALQGWRAPIGSHDLPGIGFGLLAAASYATLMLLNKFIKGLTGPETTLAQLALATVWLAVYGFGFLEFRAVEVFSRPAAFILVLGVVHTGIGFYLFFSGMRLLPGQTIAALSYIDPLTALGLSLVILGEHLSAAQLAGGALILGCTFLSEHQWRSANLRHSAT